MTSEKLTKEEKGYEALWSVLMYVNYITPQNGAFEVIEHLTNEFNCMSSKLWIRGEKWGNIAKLVRERSA